MNNLDVVLIFVHLQPGSGKKDRARRKRLQRVVSFRSRQTGIAADGSVSVIVPSSIVDGLYEISTTVRFEAPYFKVLSVLFAIEDLERLVRVDQITIDAALDEDGTNLLTATLTATAFSLSDLGVAVSVSPA